MSSDLLIDRNILQSISKNMYAVKPQLTVSLGGIQRRGKSGYCLITLYNIYVKHNLGKEMTTVSRGSR